MSLLIVIHGPQGSGKTRLAKRFVDGGAELIEAIDRAPGSSRQLRATLIEQALTRKTIVATCHSADAADVACKIGADCGASLYRVSTLPDDFNAVEDAYREGHNAGISDGHPLAGPFDVAKRWLESDALATLRESK